MSKIKKLVPIEEPVLSVKSYETLGEVVITIKQQQGEDDE